MLEYDELRQTVTLHRKGVSSDLSNLDDGSEVVFAGDEELLKREALHFLECITFRRTPLTDGANGLKVISVLEEATRLLKEGAKR